MLKQRILATNDVLINNGVCKDVRKIINIHMRNEDSLRKNIAKNSNFFVFFAKETNKALIIRKTTRLLQQKQQRFIHMLTWNLETDEITPGQWLINKKINMNRSSLSPNGDYFIYPLTISNGPYQSYIPNGVEKLTVISKPPYFSGLVVLRSNLSSYGDVYNHMLGGKWINDENIAVYSSFSLENGTIPNWLKIKDMYESDDITTFNEKNRLSKFNVKDLRTIAKTNRIYCPASSKKAEIVSRIVTFNQNKTIEDLSKRSDHIHINSTPISDTLNRMIHVDNGYLMVNGNIIYDFIKDEFKPISKPNEYDW